jgi:hypothetical protein
MSRILLALFLTIAACSKHNEIPASLALTGACSVEIESKTPDAEFLVDGIEIGHGEQAMTQVPCGEKQIRVEKHGYHPYEAYLRVSRSESLKVSVTLKKAEPVEDFALSQELLEQIREGRRIRDPQLPGAPGEPSAQEIAAAAPGTDASQSSASAVATPAAGAGEDWNTVEAWR